MSVWQQSMPLDEEIEGGKGKSQSCLKHGPGAVQHFLEMTHAGHHRQHGLHQPPRIPVPALAELEMGRVAFLGMKGGTTQDDHPSVKLLNPRREGRIRGISSGTVPRHYSPQVVEHQAELAPDNPAMLGFAFAADLLGTPPFPQGMEQLDPVASYHPQDRWDRQELVGPGAVGRKQAKEPGALGQCGKQAAPVAAHPPIEGAISDPFESKEQAQGHDFAGPETGLGMLRFVLHRLIYPVEQLTDKLFCGHAVLLGLQVCNDLQLEDIAWLFSRTVQTSTIG